MIVDTASGKVTNAMMAQSTGNATLDKVTTETFRRWRFKGRKRRKSECRSAMNEMEFVCSSGRTGNFPVISAHSYGDGRIV